MSHIGTCKWSAFGPLNVKSNGIISLVLALLMSQEVNGTANECLGLMNGLK